MPSRITPALRVTLCFNPGGRGAEIVKALEEKLSGTGYLAIGDQENTAGSGEPVGEKFELRVFSSAPPAAAPEWLDQTLHSVVVVLVDETIFGNTSLLDWLRGCGRHLNKQPKRHSLIAVPLSDDLQERWQNAGVEFGRYQTLTWYELGEKAERADLLALRVLNHMVRVLATAVMKDADWKLRLFLSHAKQDGVYLAQSLRYFIQNRPWLSKYYDAVDIEAGWSWEDQLREAVRSSLLLVLRTDAYDQRFWCRSEVRWAGLASAPVVVVDARSRLVHPACELSFDTATTVRVPDGNLPRILFAALQTALRSMLFQRSVIELRNQGLLPRPEDGVRMLPATPGIEALVQACEDLSASTSPARYVVYPDPLLREGVLKAAQAVAEKVSVRIATPLQILSEAAS
jgi:hypothetical protein